MTQPYGRALAVVFAAVCALTLVMACRGGSNGAASPPAPTAVPPTATASASPSPSGPTTATAPAAATSPPATPLPAGASAVDRVLAHIDVLAVDIGSRPAGTDQERAAADYVASVLTDAGYEVTLEPFPIELQFDDSAIALADGRIMPATAFEQAPQLAATGTLVLGGIGRPEELTGVAAGSVVLIDRGTLTFADKVRNAQNAGAAGVVIANNVPGTIRGTFGPFRPTIPVLAITRDQRTALAADAAQSITLRPSAGTRPGTSQNVVARSGASCRVILGGHYDSVPAGPGANDNASGTATMLELARAHRADGLCAVAFGAEEIGLDGSRAYVAEHDLTAVRAMLNFDMTGKITDAILVGDAALTRTVLDLLASAGAVFPIRAGSFPSNASSDHVSFAAAGIPAITVHSGDDEFIHTPEDDRSNVDSASLETMLRIADVAVAGVLSSAR